MIHVRCKCGKREGWTSMGFQDCEGCEECGTTYAGIPDNCRPLQPHQWKIYYNEQTGKPYKRCEKCYAVDQESYDAAKIKDNVLSDEEIIKSIDVNVKNAKTYDKPAQISETKEETSVEPEIPKNLEQAIEFLTNENNINYVKECKNEDDFVTSLHFGVGMNLRNNWGLWTGSELQTWFKEKGIHHADDMSSIIFTSFYRTIMNKPIDLDEQIKYYRDYWEKTDPNVNIGKFYEEK